ncbi:PAS domain S-box protein [bacterium]|nr:PAS domain S-box protein [bacterium]
MLATIKKICTKSIIRELMVGIVLVHAILITIFIVDMISKEEKFLIKYSKNHAFDLAETLAANSTSWVLSQDFIGMEEIINAQSGIFGIEYAMIVDTKGMVLAYTDKNQVGKYLGDEISKTLSKALPKPYIILSNSQLIDVAVPILYNNKHIGWARIGISRLGITNAIKSAKRNGIVYMLIAILVGTIFAWFLGHNLTTDIRKLIFRADKLKKGEKDINFILDREDELGQMSKNFQELHETLLLTQRNNLKTEVYKRNKAEQDLLSEKERLAVTLRSIGDGVITTDLDGKIVLINKITEKLTGWSQQDAVGKQIREVFNIVNEKTGITCENPVYKVLKESKNIGLASHTVLISKDGTQYIIEDSCAPILNSESKIIGTVLVYRDVTEGKKMEEELLKVKKLESVGVLAGGIAHDFNNILTAILGNIELAESYTDSTNKIYPFLQNAINASIRAKDLTHQLLTFAKGGNPVKQTSAINQIITDSANFVLHGSSVMCNYKIPLDLWKVDVDSGQISQVIQNIIINSREAMPDGGVIEVVCENIEDISNETISLPDQKYIKIIISDSGSGISDKYIDRIFDPYFTTKKMGSGLGLAICHSIIGKHDGNISVQSQLNKGTAFTIYIPAVLFLTQDPEIKKAKVIDSEKKATIMVMDDESMILETVDQILMKFGHKVILVKNGHEAIELYNKYINDSNPIDIIIMDLTIPGGMGSKDAVQEILRINPEAKAIVASGYSNDPVMANYKDYGFKASISKPFQLAELNELIIKVLE